MIKVSKINWAGDHRLRFRFTDDSVGEHDFAALVNEPGPMVEPLRDVDYFKRVFLEFGEGTANFDAMREWNHSEVYRKTIVLMAERIGGR